MVAVFAVQDLLDVNEFVDDVEVEVGEVACGEVFGVDEEASVVVYAHVEGVVREDYGQVGEYVVCVVSEDFFDGGCVFEVSEVVCESASRFG